MSATMSNEVQSLKQLVLHTPMILELEEQQLDDELLSQYTFECKENDKFLILYSLISLKLIKGKSLIFVNDIDRCYRLKLFLERFSIRGSVLNSELPQNTRFHIVEEFNRGVFDILIATDENKMEEIDEEELNNPDDNTVSIKEDNIDNFGNENGNSDQYEDGNISELDEENSENKTKKETKNIIEQVEPEFKVPPPPKKKKEKKK